MKDDIRKIYNHVLINKAYFNNLGLYYGKTGCLLFFAHYARVFENDVNNEIVEEIIDDIFAAVGKINNMNMSYGLCGIGWGIEYLLQNKLMEGDSDDILIELDSLILNKGVRNIVSNPDFPDIIRYVAVRLASPCALGKKKPFPRDFISKLYLSATQLDIRQLQKETNVIKKVLDKGRFHGSPIRLSDEMLGNVSMERFPLVELCLCNGLSGLGIKLILREKHFNDETCLYN